MRRLFNLDETNDDQVGVCIADIANQVVEYQNSTCARICGDQKGRTCANAGFTFCSRPFDFIKFGQGMHVSKSEQCCDGYFDLFLYNNTREKIICILPLTEILSARESEFNKFPLTPREREIVSLLLRRYSNLEICKKIECSENTLRTHLKNIYSKVGPQERILLLQLRTPN